MADLLKPLNLIPVLEVWGRSESRPMGFRFHWLFIYVATLRSPSVSLGIFLDEDGLCGMVHLPYLFVRLTFIKVPTDLSYWFWLKTIRTGTKEVSLEPMGVVDQSAD